MTNDASEDALKCLPCRVSGVESVKLAHDEPFVQLARRFAHLPGTVVLASGGELDCARYNILGLRPWMTLKATSTQTIVQWSGGEVILKLDPFSVVQRMLQQGDLRGGTHSGPLTAGLLGYLSYDLKDCLEELPHLSVDDLGLPQLYMAAHGIILVEDRLTRERLVHLPIVEGSESPVNDRLSWLESLLSDRVESTNEMSASASNLVSGFSRQGYMAAVDSIRDYIAQGHVYQVNMSQRFEATFEGDPYALFSHLFDLNPAPFFAYVNAGDHHLVSTSPERFLLMNGREVETRPIKGTRPRFEDSERDLQSKTALAESQKDEAELSMIVDLLRNDIGKVCCAGSVHVDEHKRLEAYQNVYHLVSIVRGRLDENRDAIDLLRATFPGGSITGCPKIRAMEIIDELEPVCRHVYTGAIGYISFHGTMDLSIAIRTAIIHAGRLLFSVGGGVVYDSDPHEEYEETLHKGRTLMNALGMPKTIDP